MVEHFFFVYPKGAHNIHQSLFVLSRVVDPENSLRIPKDAIIFPPDRPHFTFFGASSPRATIVLTVISFPAYSDESKCHPLLQNVGENQLNSS